MRRKAELVAIVAPVRDLLLAIPGCTANGVGLARAAFERLGTEGGGPEAVRPEDLVITVSFATAGALEAGRHSVEDLVGGAPFELSVVGPFYTM